jgi:hypothetical protein
MESAMAKVVQSGGQECNDADAAACLAQGHPKSGLAPVKWGMKDRDAGSEGLAQKGAHDPYAGAKSP